jgi:hypothetical protein
MAAPPTRTSRFVPNAFRKLFLFSRISVHLKGRFSEFNARLFNSEESSFNIFFEDKRNCTIN